MNRMSIHTEGHRVCFGPGSRIVGTVSWDLEKLPSRVELRLFWYTMGKGNPDVQIVKNLVFPNPQAKDAREFAVPVPPEAPCSFTGKLLSLSWALELVAKRAEAVERMDIVVSPTGEPVSLPTRTVYLKADPVRVGQVRPVPPRNRFHQ